MHIHGFCLLGDDGFIDALQVPCKWLIWLMGISIAADLVAIHADVSISVLTNKARGVGLVILIAWFLQEDIRF